MYTFDVIKDITEAPNEVNLATRFSDEQLSQLGSFLCQEIDTDNASRHDWLADNEQWLKLASQVREAKSFPWPGASNTKYPLLTIAALQFHARALPGLIHHERPVMGKVWGNDPDGKKTRRSDRVSRYMSWQVLNEMDEWMDQTDRLLFALAIVGLVYKKTYYDPFEQRNKSMMVLPSELILNYGATGYKYARMTHQYWLHPNEVAQAVNSGEWLDVALRPVDKGESLDETRDEIVGLTRNNAMDDDSYHIYESHLWMDLDGDGFREPYIVTIDATSKKIVRIQARFTTMGIRASEETGRIIAIDPVEMFTPYQLIPDPSSDVYALGLGSLVGPTNETVNSLINQLTDAGTMNNMMSGFIGRGAPLKGGNDRFRPGEWKQVNVRGDDIRKSLVPMPSKEPSGVLFSLMQMLIQAGMQTTSVSDMMLGENPGQNQKATTTLAVVEQGMAVFKSIYKRLHRGLQKELRTLMVLNYVFLDEEKYHKVLDDIVPQQLPDDMPGVRPQLLHEGSREDFNPMDFDVVPTADATLITDAQRLAKAQALMEKLAMGLPLNRQVVLRQVLEAEQHDNVDALMTIPDPGPSQEEKNFQLELVKVQIAAFKEYAQAVERMAKAESLEEGAQLATYRAIVDDTLKVFNIEKGTQQDGGSERLPGPRNTPKPG